MSSDESKPEPTKRAYDARNRRERAERERAETRGRVVEAAGRLFVVRGYTATTMTDIAHEAGVAMASLYKAGKSKADLLHLVVDVAVAGDEREVKVHERPASAAIAEETNPVQQVALIAEAIAEIQERSAPIQAAYREAAATDAAVARSLREAHERRHESMKIIVGSVSAEHLRTSVAETVDTVWAIGSTEVFLLLRQVRGWSAEHYLSWLRTTLAHDVLTEDAQDHSATARRTSAS